jgi:hypothetical protein
MYERNCSFPGCTNEISEIVDLSVSWCTKHQIALKTFAANVLKADVPEDTARFIFCHLDGCSAGKTAIALHINETVVSAKIKKGVIKATRCSDGRSWLVSQAELIRIARIRFGHKQPSKNKRIQFNDLLRLINDPLVPEKVARYIYANMDGNNIRQSAKGIGYSPETLQSMLHRGLVKFIPDPWVLRSYIIPLEELIKLAVQKYGWIACGTLARKLGVSHTVFEKYARAKVFGPTRIDAVGRLCIRRDWENKLRDLKHRYNTTKKRSFKIRAAKLLGNNEFNFRQIALMIGIDQTTIKFWCHKGILQANPRKTTTEMHVISKSNLLDFVIRASKGDFVLWHDTRAKIADLNTKLASAP